MPSDGTQPVAFGPFRLDQQGHSLTRAGAEVALGRRAFDVLCVLAAAGGEPVSKDALLDQVWPGLTVEENNLQVQISALRKVLGDGMIVTIPGRGYRLTMAVPGKQSPTPEAATGKPSIAVLPFTNMSGDIEQEYFADGVADDIITELARVRSLLVIARNSSFAYKGQAIDVRQIARELGVRYILEGSVRRSGDRVRIGAQLIDATTADHIWAERYDRGVADIFAVQDEISAAVTGAIGPAILDAEQRRAVRKPPTSLNAWEAYLRGQWHYGQRTAADHEQAKQLFERAIALDHAFAAPYAALARSYLDDGPGFGTRSMEDAATLSADWARKAIAIDPEDADARAMVALTAQASGNADEARDQALLARTSNPNSPMAFAIEGHVLLFTGQPAEARQAFTASIRLDPRGPLSTWMAHLTAISYYFERDYVRSVEAARLILARDPSLRTTRRWLAAALGQLGRKDEAQVVLHRELELSPRLFEWYTRRRPTFHRPEDYEHMLDGLRKAGWQG
jgi:adenylate cyclase